MSSNNSNSNSANEPSVVVPKSSSGLIDKVQSLITEPVHFLLRLYFSVLLLVYFWFVKLFTRVLKPLEPWLEQMHKIPAGEATPEKIQSQFSRLLYTILVFLAPIVSRVIGYATSPLIWARDKVVEYVDQGEGKAEKQTDPKQKRR
uniref:Uncharacterized protein n=1 Tax=Arion vulgaris TaxID=1028688 RepID=A0A0B6ZXM3_9EUPU